MHAHAAPTRNETRQSATSTSTPAAALPPAIPTTSAVTGHVYASVTAPAGATSPTSWFELASTGAITTPARRHSGGIAQTDGAAASGRNVSGRIAARRTYIRPSSMLPARVPYAIPPAALPSDQIASRTPDHARLAMSSLNAGSVTSIAPKQKPSGSVTSTSVCRPGERSAPSQPPLPPLGSGTHARDGGDAANANVPHTTRTIASASAATGESSAVATAVSSGPRTKTNSRIAESSAWAAGSGSGSSPSIVRHSGRIVAEMGGSAMPASSAAGTSSATGAPSSASPTSSASPAACTSASGTSN